MSKCWYCNNELTTEDNQEHFGICNKCYDEMFKSGDIIIRSLINKIADLEQELAELKQKAVVPKFKIGDKVYAIIDTFAYTGVFSVEIRDTHLLYEVWDGQDITEQHFSRIFATQEEAEQKLAEIEKYRY